MKRYKVVWKTTRYGDSYVTAKSKKEAKAMIARNEDENFEEEDYLGDWFVDEIIEVDVE